MRKHSSLLPYIDMRICCDTSGLRMTFHRLHFTADMSRRRCRCHAAKTRKQEEILMFGSNDKIPILNTCPRRYSKVDCRKMLEVKLQELSCVCVLHINQGLFNYFVVLFCFNRSYILMFVVLLKIIIIFNNH